jgi:hypothetical protein
MKNGTAPSRRHRLRRRWLGLGGMAVAMLALGAFGLPARALDVPSGKVLLVVSGKLANANQAGAAAFDLAMLQRLPQHSFSTKTPWYPQPRKFSGVLVSELLAAVGAGEVVTVRALALNDYRVDIPVDELTRHGALLAHLLDDAPMAVRDKGPLVIIFPFDAKPELRSAVHYSRAIWQLQSLELK